MAADRGEPTSQRLETGVLDRRVFDRRVLAEIVGAAWEIFSALLFSSSVLPVVASVPWTPVIFAATLVASAAAGPRLGARGARGYDVAAILPQFFCGGPMDYARLPVLRDLLTRAGQGGDTDQRRGLYSQAIRLITGQALWLPLHTYAATYGVSRALNFRPSADELPRFYLARWR